MYVFTLTGRCISK